MTKLGQHFLKSQNIVNQIIKAAELKKSDAVLEVGPGKGILTKALLENTSKVIAIEKDQSLVQYLKDKFKDTDNLELIEGDIRKYSTFNIQHSIFKVVANIPYYITSRFLRNFLQTERQPSLMVLMVQKEVAQRIMAQPPHMNKLALSVQAYGKPKIIEKVPKKYFSPQPKVDSAIIKIGGISKDFFIKNKINEKKFFNLIRKARTIFKKLDLPL
jgi:16S rRNA (adenine1518-N6/adenine1519-N6)-dimethyltransferase